VVVKSTFKVNCITDLKLFINYRRFVEVIVAQKNQESNAENRTKGQINAGKTT
jgi:hypothetical protein